MFLIELSWNQRQHNATGKQQAENNLGLFTDLDDKTNAYLSKIRNVFQEFRLIVEKVNKYTRLLNFVTSKYGLDVWNAGCILWNAA